ncbi:MAG TPA: TlpA disulfide reductase family protein [Bacteroidia bacterium]|nr:TlpA disulfide reductase family protein [Bacteroidia bacterium]
MKVYFKISLLLFIFTSVSFAQNVTIKGIAPTHKGKEISVYLYDDLITLSQTLQSSDTVDARGNFELSLSIKNTQIALIKTDNLTGVLYLQPNFVYGIVFPEKDSLRFNAGGTEQNVNLIINGDSTELNARIIDFNNCFDVFWEKSYKAFVAKKIHQKLDSFQLLMNKRYEKVKLSYFKTYVDYTFASFNENTNRHKNYLAKQYLLDKPINYNNYEYMSFFNQYFKQYIQKRINTKDGNFILDAINEQGEYKHLNELLKNDPVLINDTLRELVVLKSLCDLYFTPHFKKEKIKQMLEQLYGATTIAEHKTIAFDMLRNINNMRTGQMAPVFKLPNIKHDTVLLTDFKARYTYVNFFATWCTDCLQELKKEEQLFRKYGDKVMFISVCTDDDTMAFKNFIKQNPTYKWTFLYGGKNKKLAEQYNIKSLPVYYFISPDGYLLQSPALKPDEGIEFKFNQIFKIKNGPKPKPN